MALTKLYICNTVLDLGTGNKMLWNDKAEQYAYYMENVVVSEKQGNYIKPFMGSVKMKGKRDELDGAGNMLVIDNRSFDGGRLWYCNIISMLYVNENTTAINYVVDNWETYQHDIDVSKLSYVSRRTMFREDIPNVIKLPPESLEMGDFYRVVANKTDTLGNVSDFSKDQLFLLVSTENVRNHNNTSSISSSITSNIFYDDVNAGYGNGVGSPSPLRLYVCNLNALRGVMTVFNTIENVGKLQAVIKLPFGTDYFMNPTNSFTQLTGQTANSNFFYGNLRVNEKTIELKSEARGNFNNKRFTFLTLQYYANIIKGIYTSDYNNNTYNEVAENEIPAIAYYFMKQPFSFLEVTDFLQNTKKIDYSNLEDGSNTGDCPINYKVVPILSENPIVAWWVTKYGGFQIAGNDGDTQRRNLANRDTRVYDIQSENVCLTQSPYNAAIVTDNLNAFLQGKQNQIWQTENNIELNKQYALNSINQNKSVSSAGIQNSYENTRLSNDTATANRNIQGIGNLINLGLNQSNSLNVAGLGGSLTGMVTGQIAAENNSKTTMQIAENNADQQRYALNTSTKLALERVALDELQQIGNMVAQMQDIEAQPNRISTSGTGSYATVLLPRRGLNFKGYVLDARQVDRLADYFARYGLPYHADMPLSNFFMQVKKYKGGYIKAEKVAMRGNLPQDSRDEIITMFKNGVTLWNDIAKFEDYEYLKGL